MNTTTTMTLRTLLRAAPCSLAALAASAALLTGCPPPPVMDGGTDVVAMDNTPPPTDNPTPTDNPPPPTDGPTTDTPMGSPGCMMYCSQLMTNCTGANAQYDDMADCLAYCGAANWPAGSPGEQSGNTLACRIYHGGGPAMTDPATHCSHAGPSGDSVCGSVNFRTEAAAMYRRVDRMGMPAVSTALVGSARKNAFNDADPPMDMTFAGDFIMSLTGLHTALDDDLLGLNLTPCSMTTIVGGLPQCLGQTYAAGRTVASLVVPYDTLRIDPSQPSGFPNGRRLQDPVIDVTLSVLLLNINGGNCGTPPMPCSATTLAAPRSLNPGANDVAFLTAFPYLAAPHPPM